MTVRKAFLSCASGLMLIALLAVCMTVSVSAEALTGMAGQDITWRIDEESGDLYLEGTGTMDNWGGPTAVPWYKYRDIIDTVVIDERITSIGQYAFSGLNLVEHFSLPVNLSFVGNYIFYQCDRVQSLEIPMVEIRTYSNNMVSPEKVSAFNLEQLFCSRSSSSAAKIKSSPRSRVAYSLRAGNLKGIPA